MQLIPNGQILGSPGGAGSAPIIAFADSGDPNLRSDPQKLLTNCALGSTFQRTDGTSTTTCFYVKTGQPTAAAVNGTWTAK